MINTTSIKKNELRKECKRIRSALPVDVRRKASQRVCSLIWNWYIFRNAKTILTYMAMGSELDLSSLLLRYPEKIWGIPRVRQESRMSFHVFDPEKLTRHTLGMMEPAESCQVIHPEDADLALVPGLAFSLSGWRLGYGGGYFDRFLSEYKGYYAGITYQDLIKPQIPHEAHDIPMQFIITENGIFPTAPQ